MTDINEYGVFRLPVGFAEMAVGESELRGAQAAILGGLVDDRQRALLDACVSWVCCHAPRQKAPSPEHVKGVPLAGQSELLKALRLKTSYFDYDKH